MNQLLNPMTIESDQSIQTESTVNKQVMSPNVIQSIPTNRTTFWSVSVQSQLIFRNGEFYRIYSVTFATSKQESQWTLRNNIQTTDSRVVTTNQSYLLIHVEITKSFFKYKSQHQTNLQFLQFILKIEVISTFRVLKYKRNSNHNYNLTLIDIGTSFRVPHNLLAFQHKNHR